MLKMHLRHAIVKIPCPHCNFLCSPQIKYCSKCGEPLPQIENIFGKSEVSDIVEDNYIEKSIIHALEKLTNKLIPRKDNFDVSTIGYVKEADQITGLSLFSCNLDVFPKELLKLTSLKQLALRRNTISKLLKQIGFLSNLEYLDMRINKLKKLPQSIGLLSKLKHLNLSSNQLIELPDSIGNLGYLKVINLSNNKLKHLPQSILNLNSLEKLNLKANFWITSQEIITALEQKRIEIIF
jgi:Leucine-rich repeat (LRR) protein